MKEDRRSRKTEQALLRALSELLEEKQLREITVNELVRRADLHRSTFYTHYMDIYDLYEQTEAGFLAVYEEYVKERASHDYTDVYRSVFEYADANRSAARMFLGGNAEPSFRQRLTQLVAEQYIRIAAYEDGVEAVPEEWHAMAAYHIGGVVNMLAAWIQSGYAAPREKMIELSIQLDYRITAFRRGEKDGKRL